MLHVTEENTNQDSMMKHAYNAHLVLTWTPKEQQRKIRANLAHKTPRHSPAVIANKTVFAKRDTKKNRGRVLPVHLGIIKRLLDRGCAISVEY